MDSYLDEIFHPISLSDMDAYEKIAIESEIEACDYTFANNFIWAEHYNIGVAFYKECVLIKYIVDDIIMFGYPIGKNKCDRLECINFLKELCKKCGISLILTVITEKNRQELQDNFYGDFEIDVYRDSFDYVYFREKLATLSGKKLSAKRNHINRFCENGSWSYDIIKESDFAECMTLAKEWIDDKANAEIKELLAESEALETAFKYFTELGLAGGLIRQNGRIVAFSVGERLNKDTFVVHFEKADKAIQGAFQIINREFAKNNPDYIFFNREDDTGDMGLRKSKMSYHPDIFIKKYNASWSGFSYATQKDYEEIANLWEKSFFDDREYISFYLSNMCKEDTILCIRDKGRIVSMASIIKAGICKEDCRKDILYLYAVATLPEYRNKGLATALINHICNKTDEMVVLCPASDKLEEYYKKIGFAPGLLGEKKIFFATDKSADITDITAVTDSLAQDYFESRRKKYLKNGYVEWDYDFIDYALKEHINSGGKIVKVCNGYVLFYINNDAVEIAESTVLCEFEKAAISGILKEYGKKTAYYHEVKGVLKGPCDEKITAYMALVLG